MMSSHSCPHFSLTTPPRPPTLPSARLGYSRRTFTSRGRWKHSIQRSIVQLNRARRKSITLPSRKVKPVSSGHRFIRTMLSTILPWRTCTGGTWQPCSLLRQPSILPISWDLLGDLNSDLVSYGLSCHFFSSSFASRDITLVSINSSCLSMLANSDASHLLRGPAIIVTFWHHSSGVSGGPSVCST